MATFKIHEDAEKENPPMQSSMRDKLNVLQPLANAGAGKIAGITAPAAATLKDKQIRGNFASLNAKNGVTRLTTTGGGGVGAPPKLAFREVSNVVKDNEIHQDGGKGIKKSTVVPVMEQFKSFSVYEDQRQELSKQSVCATITETLTTKINIGKENVCIQQKHEENIDLKNTSMQRDYSITSTEYSMEGTPMSVSDVLSPMSVDRSQLEKPMVHNLHDVSDDKKIAKNIADKVAIPRNDRQRFFEVVEYQKDILEYFRESEQKHRPKPYYMQRQTDINHTMRTILVDWLVEVSEEYNLDTETLYLAVFYIDRFLSHMSVVRSKLQLVGTAAMYIASKYEEIYPPDVSEFVFITDDTYTKSQVLRMEQIILKILTFDLCTPTANAFLNTYAVVVDMPEDVKHLAHYLSELSLLEADPFLRFVPSKISAASVALARHLLDYPIWSLELQDCTSYRVEDFTEIILHLSKIHHAATTMSQQAIPEKYKSEKYKQVASTIKPIELDEQKLNSIIAQLNAQLQDNGEDIGMIGGGDETAISTTNSQSVKKMISLMFN